MIRVSFYITMLFFLTLLMSSCRALKESSKHGLSEGFYKTKLFNNKPEKVYVVPENDQIKIYTINSLHKNDTSISAKIIFLPDQRPFDREEYLFRNSSPDITLFTTFLKYRKPVAGFPRQLNTSIFNGAVYFGYRNDFVKLKYFQTPLNTVKRKDRHYGFSIGAFAGLGTTPMNEFVTQNNINIEYDGFINEVGIATFLSVRKVNIGFNFGVDHLMDPNRKFWIYQGKSWIGMSVGFHLD
jgi:hypothetical protein